MAEYKEQPKKSIRFFNDREVRAVWDDNHNKWWFSVLDIIAAINEQDDYQKTRNYWKYLKTKLKKENNELVSVTNQFKLQAPDGKQRLTDTLDGNSHVKNRKGIFEYILGGCTDTKLLNVRIFDEATKKKVYTEQTKAAEAIGESNCPYCAIGHDDNKHKIWKLSEMDADHVAAWSKGGATDINNCQILCKSHNRAKGNK